MSPRKAKETRENFEASKVPAWTAGDYGHAVRVFASKGKLKIRFQDPKTGKKRQRTLFHGDTGTLRTKAAAVAVATAEKLRSGVMQEAERAGKGPGEVTIYDVVLLYLRRAPGFPEEVLRGDRPGYGKGVSAQIRAYYEALPESVKRNPTVPKAQTLWSDVYNFLRLWRDPRFARTRPVMDLEPADATGYVANAEAEGRNPRTSVNETDRLSCAINYVIKQHRKSVGLPYNPLDGRIVDRTPADVDAYSDEEVGKLLAALERGEPGKSRWQIRVILGVASSGRRIGSILGLRLSDHDLEANTVTWRAEEAKGEAYGRGDETLPMTELHRAAVLWAMEHHPNPEGPDAPLLFQTNNPARAFPQPLADRHLKLLETAAGVAHVDRRAFHGFCRAAITKAADLFGDALASEFTGRKPETIRRYGYKKKMPETMRKVAGGLTDPRTKGDTE